MIRWDVRIGHPCRGCNRAKRNDPCPARVPRRSGCNDAAAWAHFTAREIRGSNAGRRWLPLLLWLSIGCGSGEPAAPPAVLPAESLVAPAKTAPPAGFRAGNAWWQADYLQGAKVGWTHVDIHASAEIPGALEIRGETEVSIQRFGQTVSQRIELSSVETPAGRLLQCVTRSVAGNEVQTTRCEVQGDQLHLTSSTPGSERKRSLPWRDEYRGFFGVEQSLLEDPLEPGEIRRLHAFMPMVHQVAQVELTALDWTTTPMLQGEMRLLAIEQVLKLGDNAIPGRLYADEHGVLHKQELPALQQVSYRVSEHVAREAVPADGFDLGRATIVPVESFAGDLHAARQAILEVTLREGNPSEVFPSGVGQQVRDIGPHRGELSIRAVLPDQPPQVPQPVTKPSEADLSTNALVQSDAPRVVALAHSVAQDTQDPWQIAQGLERMVHERMQITEFSPAFGTAATVAETFQGDCTEHAVLLAALCRAREIPTRVVTGLVHVDSLRGYAFHMWNEVWIQDRWVPLDGTRGRGGIGCGHLKLADSSLADGGDTAAFLPVLQVMGQLQIRVVRVDGTR